MRDLEQILGRVSMRDVLMMYGQYPVPNVRGRNNYRCFAHNDKRPSAGLTKQGNKFHCFSCNWTGNIFDVVMHFENCDFNTATKILDDRFCLGFFKKLNSRERSDIEKKRIAREKEQKEMLWWEEYERVVLDNIARKLYLFEDCEFQFRIKRGDYLVDWSNKYGDVYFFVIKQVRWLDWLYSIIAGLPHPECEYDFVYPSGKRELLGMIKSGAIII
jgi:hypothetical protein